MVPSSTSKPYLRPFLRHRVVPIVACVAGFLYPLLGIILFAVFRLRRLEQTLQLAPLFGAVLSLVLYTVEFIMLAAS